MKKYYFTCFDLETGGFNPDRCAITEGAFIAYDGVTLEEVARYTDLIQPYDAQYDKEALESTGITMEMLERKGVPLVNFIDNVANLFNKVHGGGKGKWARKTILVGHNIDGFDIPFLANGFAKAGADILDFVNEYTEDTLWMSRMKWMGEPGKFNLTSCCERAGIELVDAHRAMNDADANAKLHKYLLRCMRSQGSANHEIEEEKYRATFHF